MESGRKGVLRIALSRFGRKDDGGCSLRDELVEALGWVTCRSESGEMEGKVE